MAPDDYVKSITLVFIALSQLLQFLQNLESFRNASVERRQIESNLHLILESLAKYESRQPPR